MKGHSCVPDVHGSIEVTRMADFCQLDFGLSALGQEDPASVLVCCFQTLVWSSLQEKSISENSPPGPGTVEDFKYHFHTKCLYIRNMVFSDNHTLDVSSWTCEPENGFSRKSTSKNVWIRPTRNNSESIRFTKQPMKWLKGEIGRKWSIIL